MCGIAGEINYKNTHLSNEIYYNMKKALKPRGPDEDDIQKIGAATLIHVRLSVVDPIGGKQPMSFNIGNEKYTIIYNGELYNTEDIRKELYNYGFTFEGHSDTEVLLKAFIHWGEKCVDHFNGIFAFAIWLEKSEQLFFARDRMGVKPFFYSLNNNKFIFASEIKALLCHPDIPAQININSISQIILLGPGKISGSGIFNNILELKPGYCGWYSDNGIELWQYWKLKDKPFTDNLDEALYKVKTLVTDAITRQLVSDVPICTFLSGGLDSSIITAIAAIHLLEKGERLNTFSVDYEGNSKHFVPTHFQPSSDNTYIQMMCDKYHTIHHTITLDTSELVKGIYSSVDARDLPGMADVDASMLLFCKAVKNHSTVALSGECADEVFGGYPWYRDKDIREKIGFPWAQNTSYRMSFLTDEFSSEIDSDYFVMNQYNQTVLDTNKCENLSHINSRMKEMMRLNTDWFMQTLLDRKDRMSMANGLEVRVPFCDHRIAEYLYSMPWNFKDLDGYEKGILRKSMEGLLPKEVLWRKKSPYPKTCNPTYLYAVRKELESIIADNSSPLLRIVKKEKLIELLIDDRQTPWYGQLMTTPQTIAYFIQINYWLTKFNIKIN